MGPDVVTAVEPLLDKITEIAEQELASTEIQRVLAELGNVLGKRYTVSINLTVDVFDQQQERSLPLVNTGLAATEGSAPYRTWGDSSLQRYVVEEGIQVVPQDRCPKCWKEWDFKFKHRSCPHCGTTLGKDCKVLLDTDECPHCEEGKVTVGKPRCDKCGFEVDPRTVVWG